MATAENRGNIKLVIDDMADLFITALIAHLIGDWLINWRGLKDLKIRSKLGLLLHVFITSIPFIIMGFTPFHTLLIAISHLIIDGFHLGLLWSRYIGRDDDILYPQFMNDQAFHIIAIWAILQL